MLNNTVIKQSSLIFLIPFWQDLVLLYMEKVETSLGGKNDGQYNPKEEVFRCILTLHSLLENPPGDFPDNFREDIIKGFVGIFSYIRLVMNSPYSPLLPPGKKNTRN